MGCCVMKYYKPEQETLIESFQYNTTQPPFIASPKSLRLEPIDLKIMGDIGQDEMWQDNFDHQVSISKNKFLQEKPSVKDQVPQIKSKSTMTSETVIIDFRRPSISSPSKPTQDKSSRNLNTKFLEML